MLNSSCAKAIVEQVIDTQNGPLALRWWFKIENEEGLTVYKGATHLTKLEAMADRDSFIRDNGDRQSNDPAVRAARRAIYVTRDEHGSNPKYQR